MVTSLHPLPFTLTQTLRDVLVQDVRKKKISFVLKISLMTPLTLEELMKSAP